MINMLGNDPNVEAVEYDEKAPATPSSSDEDSGDASHESTVAAKAELQVKEEEKPERKIKLEKAELQVKVEEKPETQIKLEKEEPFILPSAKPSQLSLLDVLQTPVNAPKEKSAVDGAKEKPAANPYPKIGIKPAGKAPPPLRTTPGFGFTQVQTLRFAGWLAPARLA